jgi:glucosamine-6-phosphate deaminase
MPANGLESPSPQRTLDTPAGTVHVFRQKADAAAAAAAHIAKVIASSGRTVLGLATGSTPIGVYQRLVTLYRDRVLSFRNAVTYNLDEYYPISPLDRNSYRAFMHQHLFSHVDLPANRAHVLDGTVPESAVAEHCAAFEGWIENDGGIDLQLLGIGRNGHIGFNEPAEGTGLDEARAWRTRRVALHPITVEDAARDFGGKAELVPRHALTMGIATILSARSILILAFGKAKAPAVAAALHGPVHPRVPASLLQTVASRVVWMIDEDCHASTAERTTQKL